MNYIDIDILRYIANSQGGKSELTHELKLLDTELFERIEQTIKRVKDNIDRTNKVLKK